LKLKKRGIAVKKTVFVASVILMVCIAGTVFAQVTDRSTIGIGAEYRSKTVAMRVSRISPDLLDLDDRLEELTVEQEYNMPLFTIGLGLGGYLDLQFLFGQSDYDLTLDSTGSALSHGFTTDSETVFGLGGRLLLPLTETTFVGLYFEHFNSEMEDIDFATASPALSFTIEGTTIPIDTVSVEGLTYRETTVTPVLAAKWGKFMPYLGPRYSRITADMDLIYTIVGEELDRKIKYAGDEKWSFVIGAQLWLGENISITAEFETFENESYKIGAAFTF